MTSPPPLPTTTPALLCPRCGAEVTPSERFCEACGAELTSASVDERSVAPVDGLGNGEAGPPSESPITLSHPVRRSEGEPTVPMRRPCLHCGGVVGDDGYCETCGTKAPSPRDHYVEQPASWVAASCDRGIRHHRNEDATAVAAQPEPGSRAVLIVCDGVSTSEDSDVASLAGARAARDLLVTTRPSGLGLPDSQAAAIATSFERAVDAAHEAVIANTAPESQNAAAATFAGAVLEGTLCVFANVGDSRVYWVPDPGAGEPLLLSLDDSVAQLRIDSGVSREEAEAGPQAHAITKWLGRDSPDHSPRIASLTLTGPGWLLVCSDGLWNYASEPAHLQGLISQLSGAVGAGPLTLAEALVRWACEQGGKDNISVALARI
jgi:serine/threonine protein phosphatase PrpC